MDGFVKEKDAAVFAGAAKVGIALGSENAKGHTGIGFGSDSNNAREEEIEAERELWVQKAKDEQVSSRAIVYGGARKKEQEEARLKEREKEREKDRERSRDRNRRSRSRDRHGSRDRRSRSRDRRSKSRDRGHRSRSRSKGRRDDRRDERRRSRSRSRDHHHREHHSDRGRDRHGDRGAHHDREAHRDRGSHHDRGADRDRDRGSERERDRDKGRDARGGDRGRPPPPPPGEPVAPASKTAMSIADKLKARASGSGKTADAVRRGLQDAGRREASSKSGAGDTTRQWERSDVDLNRINYEQEASSGAFSVQRKSVLAAIEDDNSIFITDNMSHDAYHETQGGPTAEDEKHLASMFAAPVDHSRGGKSRKGSGSAGTAVAQTLWDEEAELDGATVVEEASSAGNEGWKTRVKQAQALEKVAMDKRQQRLSQAKEALAAPATPVAPKEEGVSSLSPTGGGAKTTPTGSGGKKKKKVKPEDTKERLSFAFGAKK